MLAANDDLMRRRLIWQALSDLFLDDEITSETLSYAARVSAECFYSDEELDAIYFSEVAPALAFNYYSVAGEWGCFDPDWLEQRILRSRGLGYWFDRLIVAPVPLWLLRDDWRRFKDMAKTERKRVCGTRKHLGSR